MTETTLSAKQSPRFQNGALYYYEGDTFSLRLPIKLTCDGVDINISDSDTVAIEVRKQDGQEVVTMQFDHITDNAVVVEWNEDITKLFKRGRYTWRLRYNGDYIRTLVANTLIVVE